MYQKFRSGQKLKLNDDNLLSQIGLRRWRLQKSGPLVFPSKLQLEGKKETTRLILMLLGPRSETISGLSLILVISLFKRVFFSRYSDFPLSAKTNISTFPYDHRLQNGRYSCVFKYARAVKQKVWSEAENGERYWRDRVRLALFARVRFLSYTKPILRKIKVDLWWTRG